MWKWTKRILLGLAFLLLFVVSAVVGINLWEMPPKSERDFLALRYEWDEAGQRRLTKDERREQDRAFLLRCVAFADEHPGTIAELAALLMADKRGQGLPERDALTARLKNRIAGANFNELLRVSGYGLPSHISNDVAAPAMFEAMQTRRDEPMAPWVLTAIAGAVGAGSEAAEPPPLFQEVADMIVARHAASPHIANLFSVLGNGMFSPPWAHRFEEHARKVLEINQDRHVCCAAEMALAEIAHHDPSRQSEAEERYREFLKVYDGKTDYSAQYIEQLYVECARDRLDAMGFAPIGKTAPSLEGADLEGNSLSLASYRGKVVLVTFWATWCGPCMKLVPHERALAERYADAPFAIVGVNADEEPATALAACENKGITWQSFRDARPGEVAISDQWKALFPTVYLIDHEGVIRHRYCGNPTVDELDRRVAELIAAVK